MAKDSQEYAVSYGTTNTTAGSIALGSVIFYCPHCGREQLEGCSCSSRKKVNIKMPELYSENLDTLKTIMARIPMLSKIEDIYEVEIRVRIDGIDTWAVIGYGESGDPCLLRFDPDEE